MTSGHSRNMKRRPLLRQVVSRQNTTPIEEERLYESREVYRYGRSSSHHFRCRHGCERQVARFSRYFAASSTSLQRFGCALTVLAAVFLAFQLWLNHVRRRDACSAIDLTPAIDRYESVLRHMRDFHKGTWFWSRMILMVPGRVLFYFGVRIAHPDVPDSFTEGSGEVPETAPRG